MMNSLPDSGEESQDGSPMHEISLACAGNYPRWKKYLADFCERVSRILENDGIRFSLRSRVKTFESLSEKLSFLDGQKDREEAVIKDLIGLRVVVPFQEGVEQVIESLGRRMKLEEIERKSEQLSYREFAYDSVHVIVPLDVDLGLPDCCHFGVEIQIRTILQDAWAEVEHELIYKSHSRFPNNESIRKKLACLNANLTLSDMIFQEIRDSQKEMEQWGRTRFKTLIDKAVDIDEPGWPAGIAEPGVSTGITGPTEIRERRSGAGVSGAAGKAELERCLLAGLKAHNRQDYHEAVHYYSLALEMNPALNIRSMVFSHRGMAYFMLHKETQALGDFDRSFYCDKSNYRALNYRAMVLRRMGYVEQALECFANSLELNPNQAEVYFLRSQTLAAVDREAEALQDVLKALELDPSHEEATHLLKKLSPPAGQAQAGG